MLKWCHSTSTRGVRKCLLVCVSAAWAFAAACEAASAGEDSLLPQGETKAALVSPYFPDRIHEFIWRNWNVVAPVKLPAQARTPYCLKARPRRRSQALISPTAFTNSSGGTGTWSRR